MSITDSNKFCFIILVNNEEVYSHTLAFLNALEVPAGYSVEILPIRNAVSMTSGNNNGMLLSNAKYKIYLHQDVWILNTKYLYRILDIFLKQPSIGMIGSCGCITFPAHCIWWDAPDCVGHVFHYRRDLPFIYHVNFQDVTTDYVLVSAIDGLIMATQYDLPWKEDVFDGWHFYDISQSFEFKRAKYNIAVPKNDFPWFIHLEGTNQRNMDDYYRYAEIFKNTYTDLL